MRAVLHLPDLVPSPSPDPDPRTAFPDSRFGTPIDLRPQSATHGRGAGLLTGIGGLIASSDSAPVQQHTIPGSRCEVRGAALPAVMVRTGCSNQGIAEAPGGRGTIRREHRVPGSGGLPAPVGIGGECTGAGHISLRATGNHH